jgi:hypothetical protein
MSIPRRKQNTSSLHLLGILVWLVLLTGCRPQQAQSADLHVLIVAMPSQEDLSNAVPTEVPVTLPAGSTAQQALEKSGLQPGDLDRLEPPPYTVLTEGARLRLVRVREEFEIEPIDLPFERQTVRSLDLPEGEKRLLQAGENGLEEVTRRRLFEDGLQVSIATVKTIVVKQPLAEIVMIGSQQPSVTFPIPGHLAYLSGGNAWLMSESTADRRPLVTNGRLDGRIFSLSADGAWLLYTQRSDEEGIINHLFAVQTDVSNATPVDLQAANVVHFAAWMPGSIVRVIYSTAESRDAAPGWQANNDLISVDFSANGWVSKPTQILEANSGGVYGWWGTDFRWSPDGARLAYVRPDELGLVDLEKNTLNNLMKITPFQTLGDWAWVPGIAWSPDSSLLYTVLHAGAGEDAAAAESSQQFDLAALDPGNPPVTIVPQTGMFAAPAPSPLQKEGTDEKAYQLAFLQATFPDQSQTSRYRLMLIDRDGSNKREIFPPEGAPGIEPQSITWSPAALQKEGPAGIEGLALAVIYQDDLWLVESTSGNAHQITAEGLLTRLDWR